MCLQTHLLSDVSPVRRPLANMHRLVRMLRALAGVPRIAWGQVSYISREAEAKELGCEYECGLVCTQWTVRSEEMCSQRFQNRCTRSTKHCFGKFHLAAHTGQ